MKNILKIGLDITIKKCGFLGEGTVAILPYLCSAEREKTDQKSNTQTQKINHHEQKDR